MNRRSFLGSTVTLAALTQVPQSLAVAGGRCPDVGAALASMERESVLVLKGPVGSGKTRTALKAAVDHCQARGEHVVFVRGRESPQDLAQRLTPAEAATLFPVIELLAAVPRHQWAEVMGPPQVWVEEPLWVLEYDSQPLTLALLDQASPRPTGLVVVDAWATFPRVIGKEQFPAFDRKALAPHRAGAILRRIPRLIVVDSEGPSSQAWR
jgi:hypothetical protein